MLSTVSLVQIILGALGLTLSVYAYIVETRIKTQKDYHPACDLSDIVSCSKPLQSKYANIFYVSNSFAGVLFFCTIIILTFLGFNTLIFGLSLISCFISIILAYLLYFKIRAVCLICTSIYIINFLILLISFKNL